MKRIACSLALLLVAVVGDLPAQDDSVRTVTRGTRVRIDAPLITDRLLVGTVSSVRGDTLFLQRGRRERAIPFAAMDELEISLGRDHGRGILYGAGIGGLVGGVAAVFITRGHGVSTEGKLHGILLGFGTGVFPGLAIGGLIGVERWSAVDSVSSLRVGPDGDDGVGIGLSLPTR